MKTSLITAWLLAVAVGMGATGYVQSAEVLNPPTKSEGKKKLKKSRGSRAKILSGSEETKKERDSRLKRECKGQVNAGACAGYTR